MTENPRGHSGQRSRSALDTLLTSSGPETIKAMVPIILARLTCFDRLDEAEIQRQQPDLLRDIRALTPVGLDLFRVLRGETPHPRHSRGHVGAALRYRRRAVGGCLTRSAFAQGHPVPLLADLYWGGVEAWAQAAPGRAQKPKNHWRAKATQIAALRDFAERHPNASITQATLNEAGLHALANGLTGKALEELAQAAGVSRNLKQRPNGSVTRAMVIAEYITLCDKAGIPLSSHLLTKVGPQGFTIRALARSLFGSFEAFRRAVAAVDPRFAPKARPRTKDGVLLDSFQEVIVYDQLRKRLPPEMSIVPHVLLDPALPHRSADFLIGGAVYVEVLMISLAEIDRPNGKTQEKYAGKWRCKIAWYKAGNKPLVIVEPDDVLNPGRLAIKAEEVLRLLELASQSSSVLDPASAPPAVATMRAKHYWSFERLCRVVAEVARELGHFPTHAALLAAGHASAPTMLTRFGRRRVAEHIGVPIRHEKGIWNLARVEQEMAAWVMKHDRFPSTGNLKATGHGALAGAWQRLTFGRVEQSRAAVERICGRVVWGGSRRGRRSSKALHPDLFSAIDPRAP